MKLFPLLLTGALFVPSAAFASNNQNGNGCRNRCGDTTNVTNTGDRHVDNSVVNRATGGDGGQGGQGGEGGTGYGYGYAEGGSAFLTESGNSENNNRNRNNNANHNNNDNTNQVSSSLSSEQSQRQGQSSTNTNRNRSNSRSAANNNGNSQSTNINTGGNTYTEYGDLPETAVAPLPGSGAPGQIGDIVVPLPNISAGAFASGSEYNDIYGGGNNTRNDYGVSIGINVPLGAGQFRDAAKAEMRRRSDRAQFLLIREAVWLRDNGILSEEAHPRHWAALYGATETFKF